MTWTLAQVKSAYQALSPTPASITAAAEALNAQTTTATVDVPVQSVAAYLGVSGKLASLVAWASAPPSGASSAAVVAAQSLVFALMHPQTFPVFAMTVPAINSAMQGWLSDLVAAGVLASADQAAILALSTPTGPVWQPAVTAGDVQTALALVA